MKTRNFIYTEKSSKVRRTYGGANYVLDVYEVVNNQLQFVGEVKGCTAAHMGYQSESWRLIKEKNPDLLNLMRRREAQKKVLGSNAEYHLGRNYWINKFEQLGVTLREI